MISIGQIIMYSFLLIIVLALIYVYRIIKAAMTISKISPLYNKKWNKLSQDKQLAFENLGWDPKTWDNIDMKNLKKYPKSYKKVFTKLTNEERKAAKKLGHYAFSWWLQSYFFKLSINTF